VDYQIAIPKAPEGFKPVRTTSTTTVIIGLQPNTFYTIHIRATNAFGLSPPAVVNISTEKLHTVSKPPPPHQLNSTKVTNTSIDLHWSIPNYPNGSITNYVIAYNSGQVNTTNASTNFTLTGLVPLTIYTISIAALE
jgi:chitinase